MNNKTIFQVVLLLLVLFLSIFFYLNYFYKEDSKLTVNKSEIMHTDISEPTEGTTIKEILYESYDNEGNNFIIRSKSGTFDLNTSDGELM